MTVSVSVSVRRSAVLRLCVSQVAGFTPKRSDGLSGRPRENGTQTRFVFRIGKRNCHGAAGQRKTAQLAAPSSACQHSGRHREADSTASAGNAVARQRFSLHARVGTDRRWGVARQAAAECGRGSVTFTASPLAPHSCVAVDVPRLSPSQPRSVHAHSPCRPRLRRALPLRPVCCRRS